MSIGGHVMIELFTVSLMALSLAISTVATLQYMSVFLGKRAAHYIACSSAVFTGAWIGIVCFWLGWWEFAAAMSVVGFLGVISHAKRVTAQAKAFKYEQWMSAHQRWMNAEPVSKNSPRKPRYFDPELLP
jgi:hypothetical protein